MVEAGKKAGSVHKVGIGTPVTGNQLGKAFIKEMPSDSHSQKSKNKIQPVKFRFHNRVSWFKITDQ
jgi:hypothetical protein